jgi:rhodanese-related sulfurtransferase
MPKVIDTDGVRELVARGAQLVDVLPPSTFEEEHLPGARNIPLDEIASAPDRLDPRRPVIVYCYDRQCDLSPRAAARLEQLGFSDVYDYAESKVAWLAEGLPGEGRLRDEDRAGAVAHRDVPRVAPDAPITEVARTVGDWEVAAVVDRDGVVLGVVRAEATAVEAAQHIAAVMQPAPPTVRPSISRRELAESMDRDGQRHLLVTTLDGHLVGLVRRADLDAR